MVEIVVLGAGFAVKDMTGIQSNDQMRCEDGKVVGRHVVICAVQHVVQRHRQVVAGNPLAGVDLFGKCCGHCLTETHSLRGADGSCVPFDLVNAGSHAVGCAAGLEAHDVGGYERPLQADLRCLVG